MIFSLRIFLPEGQWMLVKWPPGPLLSYKLRYIVGFGLVEMAISTNPKPTICRNLCENTVKSLIKDKSLFKEDFAF